MPLPEGFVRTQRRGSAGLDLTLPGERQRLHSAYAALHLPVVADTPLEQLPPPWHEPGLPLLHGLHCRGATRGSATARRRRAGASVGALLCAAGARSPQTWGDAVAEVREAVDFLRYYAQGLPLMQEQLLPQSEAAAALA